jgi:hypothetical protein
MNKLFFSKVFKLVFFSLFCLLFFPVKMSAENVMLSEALKAADDGDVKTLVTKCGTIVTGDADAATLAKAYTLLAIGYTLDAGNDAKDRCSGLIDLLPDEISNTPALPIIRLLAGEIKISDLNKKATGFSQDWKAVASICMYLRAVRDKSKIKKLYSYCKKYQDSIIGLPNKDWAVVWNQRLVKWQRWMQSGKGEKEKLEKLITTNGVKQKVKSVKDDQQKRFEAVSNVIKLYLQNNIGKAKGVAVKEKTTFSGTYEPVYVVLDYLSGNKLVTPEKIFEKTKSNASMWALATVAMFAKSLADSKEPNKQQLYYYIDNYDGNYKFLKKTPQIAVWKPSIDRWRRWCDSGFQKAADLEPLLLAKSKKADLIAKKSEVKDITTITLEEFSDGRGEIYKGRQKPASMNFDDNIFKKRLASLPKNLQKNEKLRYTTVKDIKPYIVRVLERSPYPKGLLTKRKRMRSGVVYMANENVLRYKKSTKAKKGKSYKWGDLIFDQYPAFMEYFAKRRLGITGAGNVSKKKFKKDAATEYLGMAILCDWFGRYDDALKHAQKAVKIYPAMNERVSRMMLE